MQIYSGFWAPEMFFYLVVIHILSVSFSSTFFLGTPFTFAKYGSTRIRCNLLHRITSQQRDSGFNIYYDSRSAILNWILNLPLSPHNLVTAPIHEAKQLPKECHRQVSEKSGRRSMSTFMRKCYCEAVLKGKLK